MKAYFSVMGAFFPQNAPYYLETEEGKKELCHFIKEAKIGGVRFVRMLLYYPFNPPSKCTLKRYCLAPWKVEKNKFNLLRINDMYFEYLGRLIQTLYREAEIVPIIAVLDFAEKHRPKDRRNSPLWEANTQRVNLYSEEFLEYYKPTLKAVKHLIAWLYIPVAIELGNELSQELGWSSAEFLKKVSKEFPIREYSVIVPTAPKADFYHNISKVSGHIGGNNIPYEGRHYIPDIHMGTTEGWYKWREDNGWSWLWRNYHTIMVSTDGARRTRGDWEEEAKLLELPALEAEHYKKDIILETQPLCMWGPEKKDKYGIIRGHYNLLNIPHGFFRNIRRYLERHVKFEVPEENLKFHFCKFIPVEKGILERLWGLIKKLIVRR